MDYLGPDRNAIGFEKAGIARAGRPVVVADASPPDGLLDALAEKHADQRLIGREFRVTARGDRFAFEAPGCTSREFPLPLFGAGVQLTNAGAVVATVDAMRPLLPVSDEAIAEGIASARVRGRFDRQVVDGVEWIFDVAHNPAAAACFAAALTELAPARQTLAVFGAMRDKDLRSVLRPFLPQVSGWLVGGIDSDRGETPERLAQILTDLGAAPVSIHADIATAARRAKDAGADRVLVFGSFYSVGPAMQAVGIY
jgi:dihydrofolate synthase/folylpolyglutamate synthase